MASESANVFTARMYDLLIAGKFTQAVGACIERDDQVEQEAQRQHDQWESLATKTLAEIANLVHPWNSECDS